MNGLLRSLLRTSIYPHSFCEWRNLCSHVFPACIRESSCYLLPELTSFRVKQDGVARIPVVTEISVGLVFLTAALLTNPRMQHLLVPICALAYISTVLDRFRTPCMPTFFCHLAPPHDYAARTQPQLELRQASSHLMPSPSQWSHAGDPKGSLPK